MVAIKRWLGLAVLVAACSEGTAPIQPVNTPTQAGTDPALAVDGNDLLMTWVGGDSTSFNVFFARSTDGGTTWTPPVKITQADNDVKPHAQASPRIVSGNGTIGVFWPNDIPVKGRRFPASQLHFARSSDGGKTWSAAVTINDDTTATAQPAGHTFHGALFVPPSTFTVAWLDSRDSASSAVYVSTSNDLGQTWATSNRKLWGDACPCCRVSLGLMPTGEVWAAWRAHLSGDVRDPVVGLISDTPRPPVRVHQDNWVFAGCPHSGPALSTEGGAIRVTWYTGKPGATGIFYSESPDGVLFSEPVALITGASLPVAHPAMLPAQAGALVASDVAPDGSRALTITHLHGRKVDNIVLTGSVGADHPQLVRLQNGTAIVAWTEKKGNASRIRVAKIM